MRVFKSPWVIIKILPPEASENSSDSAAQYKISAPIPKSLPSKPYMRIFNQFTAKKWGRINGNSGFRGALILIGAQDRLTTSLTPTLILCRWGHLKQSDLGWQVPRDRTDDWAAGRLMITPVSKSGSSFELSVTRGNGVNAKSTRLLWRCSELCLAAS